MICHNSRDVKSSNLSARTAAGFCACFLCNVDAFQVRERSETASAMKSRNRHLTKILISASSSCAAMRLNIFAEGPSSTPSSASFSTAS